MGLIRYPYNRDRRSCNRATSYSEFRTIGGRSIRNDPNEILRQLAKLDCTRTAEIVALTQ
jgi:hypothetical protein